MLFYFKYIRCLIHRKEIVILSIMIAIGINLGARAVKRRLMAKETVCVISISFDIAQSNLGVYLFSDVILYRLENSFSSRGKR